MIKNKKKVFILFIIHYQNSKQCLLLLKNIAVCIGILYLINGIVTSLLIYFHTICSSIKNKIENNELSNYTDNYLFYLPINMDFYLQL